jgi:putative endonuclease
MVVYTYHEYYIHITSNPERSVLYTGVTNNAEMRLIEHWSNRGQRKTFAGRYYCYNRVHYEVFSYINDAIRREKEIKRWSRKKKVALINAYNPE